MLSRYRYVYSIIDLRCWKACSKLQLGLNPRPYTTVGNTIKIERKEKQDDRLTPDEIRKKLVSKFVTKGESSSDKLRDRDFQILDKLNNKHENDNDILNDIPAILDINNPDETELYLLHMLVRLQENKLNGDRLYGFNQSLDSMEYLDFQDIVSPRGNETIDGLADHYLSRFYKDFVSSNSNSQNLLTTADNQLLRTVLRDYTSKILDSNQFNLRQDNRLIKLIGKLLQDKMSGLEPLTITYILNYICQLMLRIPERLKLLNQDKNGFDKKFEKKIEQVNFMIFKTHEIYLIMISILVGNNSQTLARNFEKYRLLSEQLDYKLTNQSVEEQLRLLNYFNLETKEKFGDINNINIVINFEMNFENSNSEKYNTVKELLLTQLNQSNRSTINEITWQIIYWNFKSFKVRNEMFSNLKNYQINTKALNERLIVDLIKGKRLFQDVKLIENDLQEIDLNLVKLSFKELRILSLEYMDNWAVNDTNDILKLWVSYFKTTRDNKISLESNLSLLHDILSKLLLSRKDFINSLYVINYFTRMNWIPMEKMTYESELRIGYIYKLFFDYFAIVKQDISPSQDKEFVKLLQRYFYQKAAVPDDAGMNTRLPDILFLDDGLSNREYFTQNDLLYDFKPLTEEVTRLKINIENPEELVWKISLEEFKAIREFFHKLTKDSDLFEHRMLIKNSINSKGKGYADTENVVKSKLQLREIYGRKKDYIIRSLIELAL